MKAALQIATKTLREMLREKIVLVIIFLFPVLMIGLYAISYGDTGAGFSSQMKIGILQPSTQSGSTASLDQQLMRYLQSASLDGAVLYDVHLLPDRKSGIIALQEKQLSAMLVLPSGLQTDDQIPLELIGDTYSSQFTFAQSLLLGSLEEFNRTLLEPVEQAPQIAVTYEFLQGTGTLSDLEFGLPGILVFGLMFLSISTTQLVVREKTAKTLLRYRMSGIRPACIFLGLMISQIVVAIVLIPFTLFCAAGMGFHTQSHLWQILLISTLLSIAAVGIGLMVACFTKNESEAINISSSIVVPLVLLSNTLYPMPRSILFEISGMSFSVFDFLPTSVAADLLRNSMVYLKSLPELLPWLLWLVIQSLVIFFIGAWMFNHFLYRRQQA